MIIIMILKENNNVAIQTTVKFTHYAAESDYSLNSFDVIVLVKLFKIIIC